MRYRRSRVVAGGTAYDYTCQFPECKCEMVVESKQTADLATQNLVYKRNQHKLVGGFINTAFKSNRYPWQNAQNTFIQTTLDNNPDTTPTLLVALLAAKNTEWLVDKIQCRLFFSPFFLLSLFVL